MIATLRPGALSSSVNVRPATKWRAQRFEVTGQNLREVGSLRRWARPGPFAGSGQVHRKGPAAERKRQRR